MAKISNLHRVFYSIMGLCLFGFGLKTILAQEISAAGSRWRGAGWVFQGDPAILVGILLSTVGAYILFLAIKR
jgi:hypothetical protein